MATLYAVRGHPPSTRWSMRSARHFLAIPDFSTAELLALFDLAARMKRGDYGEKPLAGKTLGMIFAKSSTRTRVSFEVGAYQLGGHALFLSSRDIQLGRGEPIRDTARVLSRYLDGIMIRTFDHADVEELARYGSDPGDQRPHRPAPSLPGPRRPAHRPGDARRLGGEDRRLDRRRQQHGQQLAQRRRHPRLRAAARLSRGLPSPTAEILERNRKLTTIILTDDPREAARGAHVVNTDVWASMGQEEEQEERARAFQGYIVDEALMRLADPKRHLPPLPPGAPGRGGVGRRSSRARSRRSGTRPRTGCTCRRR